MARGRSRASHVDGGRPGQLFYSTHKAFAANRKALGFGNGGS